MGRDTRNDETPPLEGGAAGSRRRRGRALSAVALLALVAYANTLRNGLTYDDQALIPRQSALHDPFDLWRIASSTYWGLEDDLYRPLTLWTMAVNHGANRLVGFPGAHPFGYHLVNLLLHAGVCCGLYLWLRELRFPLWPCLAAALVFAVHPLHTEAVAPVVGRSELLAALFGLLFLMVHRAGRSALLGALCFLLALTSKESAVAFLPLAFWAEICFAGPRRARRWGAVGLYATTLLGWLALRAAVVPAERPGIPFVDNPLAYASLVERWLTAAAVQLDYLRLLLLPTGLCADYSYNQIPVATSLRDMRVVLFVVVFVGAAGLAWRLRHTHRVVVFAVAGYAGLFTLTSNFVFPIGTIMGERLAYAPSACSCLLLGYGVWRLRRRAGPVVTVAFVILLAVLTLGTVERNATWRDEGTQLRALVSAAPDNAKAHYLMAGHLLETGDPDGAVGSARRALAILPTYAEAWHCLGQAQAARGELGPAIEAYEHATRLFAGYAEAWGRLGIARTRSGALTAALEAFDRALELEPERAEHHYGRGLVLHRLGRLGPAAESYREALRLDPDDAATCSNLGSLLAAEGRLPEAATLWRKALALDPEHAAARENLERLRSWQENVLPEEARPHPFDGSERRESDKGVVEGPDPR